MRLTACTLLLVSASLLCRPCLGADRVLLKAGRVHTIAGETFAPGEVLIEDGKIVAVGASLKDVKDAKVVDRPKSVVMPGLVNAYSQMAVSGGSSEFTRELTPSFQLRGAIDWRSAQFRAARESGVTTVCLSPGTENVISGSSMVVKTAGTDLKQRMVDDDFGMLFTVASDPASRNSSRRRPDSIYVRQPTNRMGVVWMLRSTLTTAKANLKKATPALRQALEGKRPIFAVSRTSSDLSTILNLSEKLDFDVTIVGGQEAHKVKERIANRKISVVLGSLSTRTIGGVEGSDAVWNNAGALHEAGVAISLTGGDLLEQARFAVRFGLPEEAALKAITTAPAKVLGLSKRVGAIAKGCDADLVLLNGPPLEFTTQVEAVMIDGVLYE